MLNPEQRSALIEKARGIYREIRACRLLLDRPLGAEDRRGVLAHLAEYEARWREVDAEMARVGRERPKAPEHSNG